MTVPFSKIALVYPPISFGKSNSVFIKPDISGSSIYPPLGIFSLAAYLRRRDPKANLLILDGNLLDLGEIKNRLLEFRPTLVGISPVWCSYENALKIGRLCKFWNAKIILGGHYTNDLAKEIIENRGLHSRDYCVDAVCRYDGEEAFWQVVLGKAFGRIANLVFREGSKIKSNPVKFLDLNKLPAISDSLTFTDIESYRRCHVRNPLRWGLTVYSRKGCAWRKKTGGCLFCSMMKDYRFKSPKVFFEELDDLIKKYRPEHVFDVADNFLDNSRWFESFYNLYRNYPQKPQWQIYARLDNLAPQNLPKLGKINVSFIVIGMESGSDAILSRIKKGYSPETILKTCRILKKFNFDVSMCLVLGGVGESRETLKATLSLARKIKKENKRVKFQPFFFQPLPGSPAYKILAAKTDSKYLGNDAFDPMGMYSDWLKKFTKVNFNQAEAASRELLNL